jgi:hypothetical protein
MTNEPTLFGTVVLELMRKQEIADASELGLDRLALRALRRHFDGEKATPRRRLCAHVADALDASDGAGRGLGWRWLGWAGAPNS